ncbi:transcription factor bHLH130, putative [Medicago truncatula]|uniref:Transcription factor bHLH130, putative n=1 Tax=Medicago truncatula TaxID=3880 RepID=G7KL48_MEDTR|nr:transcription factor bHLH130, putative [Medicago truncatula]
MDFADSRFFCYMQNVGVRNQVDTLSHHLSLTRKSSEMFVVENLLQFPDSVTSSIRAKRGFARHPRSLAKRVRRTRINERMRKLQEVVLNIDKTYVSSHHRSSDLMSTLSLAAPPMGKKGCERGKKGWGE